MPKAEAGSVKDLANRMRRKGLGRLRWYCQVCERQMPDAHGFKLHTQSESHVRQMILIGEDPKKHIDQFSKDFLHDFLLLLRTGHGDKQVHMNQFYQEYIANKQHIHMNATKWPSLTEFAKYLGREGICRVEENDKGLHIAWIDNSPEALRRQEALRRKEAQDQGNEQQEQRMIREQIRRAQATAEARGKSTEEKEEDRELKRQDDAKIKLSFGAKPEASTENTVTDTASPSADPKSGPTNTEAEGPVEAAKPAPKASGFGGISMKLGGKPQTKNVFAQAKKNALSSGKKSSKVEEPKKMSEAERIMKEEMERKRSRGSAGFGMPSSKKQRSS